MGPYHNPTPLTYDGSQPHHYIYGRGSSLIPFLIYIVMGLGTIICGGCRVMVWVQHWYIHWSWATSLLTQEWGTVRVLLLLLLSICSLRSHCPMLRVAVLRVGCVVWCR